jgi:hypothetical protein
MFCTRVLASVGLVLMASLCAGACKPYDATLLRLRRPLHAGAGKKDAAIDAGMTSEAGPPPCVPEPERCNRMDDDCDGKIDEDALVMCQGVVVNADTECVAFGSTAGCALYACHPGYEDCDGNPANGCEPFCTCHDCPDGGEPDAGR